MSITSNNIVLFLIVGVYTVSWFLPVISGGTTIGYGGAVFALNALKEGLAYIAGHAVPNVDTLNEALLYIIAGLCNIVFIVAALLAFIKPTWSYILSPFVVVSMLVWFSMDLGIGYYLWLLSGVSLFLYSLYIFRSRRGLPLSNILSGSWSLPIYVPVILTGALYFVVSFE